MGKDIHRAHLDMVPGRPRELLVVGSIPIFVYTGNYIVRRASRLWRVVGMAVRQLAKARIVLERRRRPGKPGTRSSILTDGQNICEYVLHN